MTTNMKQLSIISFGQIAEITGRDEFVLEADDTNALKILLSLKFPQLKNTKYAIAVNKQIVKDNMVFTDHAVIALLPPFSGG
jgi:molybdopterin synthase sulfur carrier subunit